MSDNSWRNLKVWERVKWARSQRFENATAAAAALGMLQGTYRCYERGPEASKSIPLDYRWAKRFAREFRVRWEWLLEGEGEPWLTPPSDESTVEAPLRPPNNLRAWREFRGLTVKQLAARSKLSEQTIAGIESGEIDPSLKLIYPLAKALGTTAGHFVDLDPREHDPAYFDAAGAVPKERRGQAMEILKTFRPPPKLR